LEEGNDCGQKGFLEVESNSENVNGLEDGKDFGTGMNAGSVNVSWKM